MRNFIKVLLISTLFLYYQSSQAVTVFEFFGACETDPTTEAAGFLGCDYNFDFSNGPADAYGTLTFSDSQVFTAGASYSFAASSDSTLSAGEYLFDFHFGDLSSLPSNANSDFNQSHATTPLELTVNVNGTGFEFINLDLVESPLGSSNYLSLRYPDGINPVWPSAFTGPTAVVFAAYGIHGLSQGAWNLRTSAVPLPSAVWLFGSGLLVLVRVSRQKKY